jgi:DNA adenine methylase
MAESVRQRASRAYLEARPFLKWAGGKTSILSHLQKRYPSSVRTYYDPFLGSGAVAFDVLARLKPARAVLSDRNPHLIEAFVAVRDHTDAVLELLREHNRRHCDKHYYAVRAVTPATVAERGARLIYLNKTCFNGLYRLNSKGGFNVPVGRHKAWPLIVDEPNLRFVSSALQGVELRAAPFHEVLEPAGPGDFVYLDPPYDPLSFSSSFTKYDGEAFDKSDQTHLAAWFRVLAARGCHVVASNHNTPLICALYDGVERDHVGVLRRIAAKGQSVAKELVLVADPVRNPPKPVVEELDD